MTLRIGIVGAGKMGFAIARKLKDYPDVQIVAVAEPARPARDAFARAFGTRLAVSDHRRLAGDEGVDIVYLCSPPTTHGAIAVDSLGDGKHVICTQPMAVTMDQADEMMQAAEESARRLFVALPQRYDPVNQVAAKLLVDDEIGYPFMLLLACVVNEYDSLNDWHDWRGTWDVGGGGVLMERGSELMDLLRYLLGETDAVNAVCTRFAIEPLNKAEDSCVISLEFADEITGELAITGAARYSAWPEKYAGNALRLEVFGLEGSMRIAYSEPRITIVTRKQGERSFSSTEIQTGLPTDMDRDFLDCIVQGGTPLVTPEDAREALRVVLAAYKASQMKRRVELIERL
jgi:predicted dehydrogenase